MGGTVDQNDFRIGTGFDFHRLVADRRLVLGGVEIPFELGLLGHSDADVLLHAVCDAILGALGLGDIGRHFPDTDARFKDISSRLLLEDVAGKMRQAGFQIGNLDVTVLAERPKIFRYCDAMRDNLARALDCRSELINIKATSLEGAGAIGRGEGIAAQAAVLLRRT